MSNSYETRYVFSLFLEGEQAVQQAHTYATKIREAMMAALSPKQKDGGVQLDPFSLTETASAVGLLVKAFEPLAQPVRDASRAIGGFSRSTGNAIEKVNNLTAALTNQQEAIYRARGAFEGYAAQAEAFNPNITRYQQETAANIPRYQREAVPHLTGEQVGFPSWQGYDFTAIAPLTSAQIEADLLAQRNQLTMARQASQLSLPYWDEILAEAKKPSAAAATPQQLSLPGLKSIEANAVTVVQQSGAGIAPTGAVAPQATPVTPFTPEQREDYFNKLGIRDWRPNLNRPMNRDEMMESIGQAANEASMRVYGLRHLGYGLRAVGADIGRAGEAMLQNIREISDAYVVLDEAVVRTAQSMELPSHLIGVLETEVMDLSEAMGMLEPDEIAEGVRVWAAGMGFVVTNTAELNAALEQTIAIQQLAALNNVSLETTVDAVAGAMLEFGVALEDTDRVAEQFNFTAAKTFANVDDLGQSMKMVGPMAAQMGVSLGETLATLGQLSDANIKGETAGRTLRQMFIRLAKPTAQLDQLMQSLLITSLDVGQSWKELVFPEGEFMGLAEYIDLLAASVEHMSEQERLETVSIIATAQEMPGLTSLIENQIEAREKNVNAIRAFDKVSRGVYDEETERYKKWIEEITGMPFSLQSATQLMEGQWAKYNDSVARRWESMTKQFENSSKRMGRVFSENLIGPLERLADLTEKASKAFVENPALSTMYAAGAATTAATQTVVGKGLQIGGILLGLTGNIRILNDTAKSLRELGVYQQQLIELTAKGVLAQDEVAQTLKTVAAQAKASAGGATFLGFLKPTLLKILPILGGALAVAAIAAIVSAVLKKQRTEATATALESASFEDRERLEKYFTLGKTGAYIADTPQGEEAAMYAYEELRRQQASEYLGGKVFGEGYIQFSEDAKTWLDKRLGLTKTLDTEEKIRLVIEYMEKNPWRFGTVTKTGEEENTRLQQVFSQIPGATRRDLGIYTPEEQELARAEYERQQEWEEMTDDHYDRLKEIHGNYLDSKKAAEESFGSWLSTTMRDQQRAEARYAEDYERRRQEIMESAHKDREEETRQHVSKLEDLYRSHMDTLIDLLEARDARAIIKQIASYKRQREEEQRQFSEQRSQSEDKTAKELADLEADYTLASDRRREDLDRQIADRREALGQELAALKETRDEETRLEREAYDERYKLWQYERDEALKKEWGIITDMDKLLPEYYRIAEQRAKALRSMVDGLTQEELLGRDAVTKALEYAAAKRSALSVLETARAKGTIDRSPPPTSPRVSGEWYLDRQIVGGDTNLYDISISPQVTVSGLVGMTEEELEKSIWEQIYEALNSIGSLRVIRSTLIR